MDVVGVVGLVAAAAVVGAPVRVRADPTNRNLIPFGERAAMLGNTGITSSYGEAIFYNPANLARVGHPNLSVSGSTYLVYQLSQDAIVVLDGEDQPFEASGFVAIPSTVISTYRIGRLALANAILVPEALTFKNRVTFETAAQKVTVLQEVQQSQLWIGGGAALEVAPGLSVGLSVFVANTTESKLNFLRQQTGIDPVTQVFEQTLSTDVSVIGMTAIGGVHYQRDGFGIGARVHSPSVRLRGHGDIYRAQARISQTNPAAIEEELSDVEVDRPLPLDVGLGVSLQVTPDLLVVADVNLQLPTTMTTVDDPRAARTEIDLELAPRGGLGLDWQVAPRRWIRAGAMINRSATATPTTADDATREDYIGASAGFAWQSGRTHTALGAFYLHGDLNGFVEGVDPPRRADARARLFGGLFTVSYRL